MVFPAIPEFVQVKKVVTTVLPVIYVAIQAVCHAIWIEQYTMRVVQYIETVLFEAYSHILSKAGTCKEQLAVVTDSLWQRRNIDTERVHSVNILKVRLTR